MAKQLNVNLAMTADTGKARAELQALQKQLDSLMMSANKKDASLGLSSEIQKATQMVAQLKVQLESATSSTGKLDLTKFNESLQKSGASLNSYRTALQSLGPAGTQAFSKLASSIMQAEVPLRRSNALLSNFATTLKNTARWQISSSILHGFMGTLSGAYRYAQDLNESLNNIRIVTGQSVDQMAQFAEQANKAARALSTTTTAYTDAALIYYQQGLTGKAVTERTDTTIKLANVSRQSAEEVSSQMTAIWNNFDDGSKSLEYYADVITKLGASTASSSDEIAQGLSKFAAVADTVGLSYEKATAALATVVAETRQSADVVGTAFKTMFARFQGLSLGDTLEDGVDLNKYSKALATIGVNILDANGELKVMDDILDETAERWNQIGEAQRVALAETVAGTRQYAQFMAIMNNYDKIQVNQGLAEGAEGTLQKQADIYAESWEAAGKRVKAAAQSIYSDLLDDKFFIKLLNNLEKVIAFFDKLIDNTGGLKGVLLTLGSVFTTVFGPQMQAQLNNMVASIAAMTPKGQQAAMDLRRQATAELGDMAKQSAGSKVSPQQGAGMEAAYSNQAQLQQALLDNAKNLTAEEQQRAQLILDMNNQLGQEAIEAGKVADARERELAALSKKHSHEAERQASQTGSVDQDALQKVKDVQQAIAGSTKSMELLRSVSAQVGNTFQDVTKPLKQGDQETKQMVENFKAIAQNGLDRLEKVDFGKFGPDATTLEKMDRLREIIIKCGTDFDSLSQKDLDELSVEIQQVSDEFETAADDIEHNVDTTSINCLGDAYNAAGMEAQQAGQAAQEFVNGAKTAGSASVDASDKVIQLGNSAKSGSDHMRQMGQAALNFGSVMSTTISTIMSVASAINMIKNIGRIWSDEDATFGEKILQTLMGLGAILPLIANMTKVQTLANTALAASNAAVKLSLLEVYLIIAAVVAIGAILVKIFENIKKASPEGKLKAAREEAKALDDALNDATTAANDLRSAIEKYNEVEEKLKSCTKGTQEWRDALKEVNDAAADVINNIHGLSAEELKNSYNTDNGYISFNDGALEMFQKKADMAVSAANYAVTISENNIVKAQNSVDLARISDEFFAKGALNTEPADNLHWTSLSDKILKNLDVLANANIDNFRDKLTDFGINVEDVSEHDLEALRQQVIELANSAELADEKLSLLSKLKVEDITENKHSDAVEKVVADQLEARTKEIAQDYKDRLTDEGKYRGSNSFRKGQKSSSALQEILNELNSAQNTNWVQSANAIRGNDKNRTFEFLDAAGEKHELTAQQIADTIAAAKALEEVTGSAKKAAEALSGVSQEGQSFIANEGFDNLTYDQYTKMAADYEAAGSGYNYFKNQGIKDEELAKQLGEQLDTAFETGIDWEGIISQVPQNLSAAFSKAIGGLTESQANSIITSYNRLSSLSDKSLSFAFDTILEQIAPEKMSEVLAKFGEVNFNDWDSIEAFKQYLLDLGIEFKNVNLDTFIQKLGLANNAIKNISVDELAEKFGKIQKIIDKITVGGEISAKDYGDLSPTAQKYFKQGAGEGYIMVGSPEQMKREVGQERRTEIGEDINYTSARLERAQSDISATEASLPYAVPSAVAQAVQYIEDLTTTVEQEKQTLADLSFQYLSTAENIQELEKYYSELISLTGDSSIVNESYGQTLITIASQYDTTAEELDDYLIALANGNEAEIKLAQGELVLATAAAENAKAFDLEAKTLESTARYVSDMSDSNDELADSLKQDKKEAAEIAKDIMRYGKAVESVAKNQEKWNKALKSGSYEELAEVLPEMAEAYGNLLDIDGSHLSESFLRDADNLKLMQDAIDGVEGAYDQLMNNAQDNMLQLKVDPESEAELYNSLNNLSDHIRDSIKDIEVGAELNDEGFLQSLSDLVNAAGMTAAEATDYLSSMGIDAEVEEHTDTEETTDQVNSIKATEGTPVHMKVPVVAADGSLTFTETDVAGVNYELVQSEQPKVSEQAAFALKVTSAKKSSGGGFKKKSSSSSHSSGSKGGGGGGKSATHSAETRVDEEHRYDKLNKEIEGLSKQYDRLAKARDRAYGANKIALMEQEIKKLKQLKSTYEEYLKEIAGDNWKSLHDTLQKGGNIGQIVMSGKAGGNLQKDYNKLTKLVKDAVEYIKKDKDGNQTPVRVDWQGLKQVIGVDAILNEFGELQNKDEIEEAIEAWWNKAYVEWWRDLSADDQALEVNIEQKEKLAAIKSYMEKLLAQYEQTADAFQEQSDNLQDTIYDIQNAVYQQFRYKLDLKVEISERSLKRIEYAIKVLGDNIYKIPEVMRTWFDERVNKTLAEVKNLGDTWANGFAEAKRLHDAGEISDEDYVQLIKDAQDGLYDCIDKLLEMNEEMREYYKNVLSHVQEEMARITDEMDHQAGTLEHLVNVLGLLGRATDYEALGKIMEAQMKANKNAYEVSKAQTEMYRRQVAEAEAHLQELIAAGVSDAALEEWKNAVLYPAKAALLEAEKEMQADFEAYLEVINALYENKINQIYQESERRLSGMWGSFDQLNNAIERQQALQDEYLTKTNQIYETNTLLRKLSQDIDKANSASAKAKLKNFSDEIESMQQQNKLNKTDLEIAKARYEVLQAQIALEEAQNAKSTVRLQRDNEGNYGYVYTADQEAIDNAEQNLEDKNNDLYNLVLGQANDYGQKIMQTVQERNAALKQLDLDYKEGRIKDEETYNKLKQDIVEKYNGLLEAQYHSYYTALGWLDEVAATDHTEAWITSFEDILDDGSDFQKETDTLIKQTGAAIDWLNELRRQATEEAKVGNGELEDQLKEITDANDKLAEEMKNQVIPAMEEVLTTAQELTLEWAKQYDMIMELINAYLGLIDAMNDELKAMSDMQDAMPEEEFDLTQDYSKRATDAFAAAGYQIDAATILELLNRNKKEELLGGHNEEWATAEQILQMMQMVQDGNESMRGILDEILSGNQFYTADLIEQLGITGEGIDLEAILAELQNNSETVGENSEASGENTEAQNTNAEEASNLSEKIEDLQSANEDSQDVQEEATEQTEEMTDTSEESANKVYEAAENVKAGLEETTENVGEIAAETGEVVTEASNIVMDAANIMADAVASAASEISSAASSISAAASSISAASNSASSEIASMDTGGYTGTWGTSGKLAVLHEKELVLNQDDTQHLFKSLAVLEQLNQLIGTQALNIGNPQWLNSPAIGTEGLVVAQDITIHADFPNAKDHNEIEEAFENLINRAAQYANRYR